MTRFIGTVRSNQILKQEIARLPSVDKEALILGNCRRISNRREGDDKYWVVERSKLATSQNLEPINPIIVENVDDSDKNNDSQRNLLENQQSFQQMNESKVNDVSLN